MPLATPPPANRLLAALPRAEWARLMPHVRAVELPLGKVLYEPGSARQRLYFPTTAIVSLTYVTEGGASTQLAVIGRDGLVGVSLFLGGGTAPHRAVVQSAGQGLCIDAEVMKHEFEHSVAVRHLMLRYTQALITQMAQTAACVRHHSIDQRLCRWLLMNLDRSEGAEVFVTQEAIAHVLGVRREGVTEAAHRLQTDGVIRYSRGHITVLDRAALEHRTCECYAVVNKEYDRLLTRGDVT
jgi:CRP-like cAMP-binding protein